MPNISKYLPYFIFFIAFVICSLDIWGPSIYILDEAKNATCAREMMDQGEIFVPTFNYELRTDKPPLHYFFMMLAYKLFGVNAFSARLFSAIFGALTVLITYLFTKRLHNHRSALLASVVLIASTHFALQFHLAVPDPYLVFFITLACFSFIYGFIKDNFWFIYLAYLSIGLGVLAKGPIAIALPGLTLLVYLLMSRRFNLLTIFQFKPISGLALAFVICGWWYAGAYFVTEGAWTRGFFVEHNLERFADPKEGHGGFFFLTWIYVLVGMLPFSVFIPQAFKNWWKSRKDDFVFFCGLAALVVIVFFTISDTKLPNYTVPAYPFLAVLIGVYLSNIISKKISTRAYRISVLLLIIISALLPAVIYFGLQATPAFEHLKGEAIWLIGCTLFASAGQYLHMRGKKVTSLIALSLAFIWFSIIFFAVIFPKVDAENPVRKSWKKIDPSHEFAYFQRFNPSFSFYLKKPIKDVGTVEEVIEFFKENPDGYVISRSDYSKKLEKLDQLKLIINEHDLFETKNTMVFRLKE